MSLVEQTKRHSRWSANQTLSVLEIARSTYQRWLQATPRPTTALRSTPSSFSDLLLAERQAVLGHALAHPEVRHRELAWKMLDVGSMRDEIYRTYGGNGSLSPKRCPGARGSGRRLMLPQPNVDVAMSSSTLVA